MSRKVNRRRFIGQAAAIGGAVGLSRVRAEEPAAAPRRSRFGRSARARASTGPRRLGARPKVTCWNGPGDGRWYDPDKTSQDRVDEMMRRAVCEVAGEADVAAAWDKLFRCLNRRRGKATSPTEAAKRSSSSRTGSA